MFQRKLQSCVLLANYLASWTEPYKSGCSHYTQMICQIFSYCAALFQMSLCQKGCSTKNSTRIPNTRANHTFQTFISFFFHNPPIPPMKTIYLPLHNYALLRSDQLQQTPMKFIKDFSCYNSKCNNTRRAFNTCEMHYT